MLKDGRWTATTDLSDVPVPPTISALLSARLDRLPTDERRLIEIASVMGQVFYSSAVLCVGGRRPRRGSAPGSPPSSASSSCGRNDPTSRAPTRSRSVICSCATPPTTASRRPRAPSCTSGSPSGWMRREDRLGSRTRSSAITSSRPTVTGVELGATGERERQLADAAGRRLAVAGERAYARSDYSASINLLSRASTLLDPDDPLRLGFLPDLGSALNRPQTSTAPRSSSARPSSEPQRPGTSRCACTPSSSDG